MGSAVHKRTWMVLSLLSMGLLLGSHQEWLPISLIESFGFVTGAVCVLLVVEQNIWNFPIGIANNVFFIILFIEARLYGDMALQFVYVVLGFMGWYQWLYGGESRTALHVSHMPVNTGAVLAVLGAAGTAGLTVLLAHYNDSAPFLDALTTVLSLVAQYLLNGKRIENWYVWITADVIYIYLYAQKELYLTAALYALFIVMCLAGLAEWKRTLRELPDPQLVPEEA